MSGLSDVITYSHLPACHMCGTVHPPPQAGWEVPDPHPGCGDQARVVPMGSLIIPMIQGKPMNISTFLVKF